MLENLFVPEDSADTNTSEIELSEDVNSWPMEIQSAIYSSIPMLADAPGQLFVDTIDKDKLYAKGSFVVQGPDDDIIIPIIVKAKQLQPLDLYIYKGEWHPVDAQEMASTLTSASMGTKLVDPRDIPPTALTGLLNRISPPGGYGTGVVSSVATKYSAANPEITDKIKELIKTSSKVMGRLVSKPNTKNAFVKLLDAEVTKTATLNPLVKDAIILSMGAGNFSVKFAEKGVVRSINYTGDELATAIKTAGIDPKTILPQLVREKFATTWDDTPVEITEKAANVTEIGTYNMTSRAPLKNVESVVIGKVKTASGDKLLAVSVDGTYALQDKMRGVKLASNNTTGEKCMTVKLARDISIGDNCVVPLPEKTAANEPLSVLHPVVIKTITNQKKACVVTGTSEMGKVAFVVMEGFEYPIKAAHVPEGILVDKLASVWYVPSDYTVFNIPSSKSELVKTAEDLKHLFSMSKMAEGGLAPIESVRFWRTSSNSVAVKIGAANPKIISNTEAMLVFKMAEGSGVMESMGKLASGEVKVLDMLRNSQGLKTLNSMGEAESRGAAKSEAKKASVIDQKLMESYIKVASMFDDEEDVNTVLSLNYITPENMQEFKEAIPEMKATEGALAKLLMSVRLGNTMVEEQDVKITLENLHEIIRELEGSI